MTPEKREELKQRIISIIRWYEFPDVPPEEIAEKILSEIEGGNR